MNTYVYPVHQLFLPPHFVLHPWLLQEVKRTETIIADKPRYIYMREKDTSVSYVPGALK